MEQEQTYTLFTQAEVDKARKEGYDTGNCEGYDDGYDEGYDDGYDEGYDDGHDTEPESSEVSD